MPIQVRCSHRTTHGQCPHFAEKRHKGRWLCRQHHPARMASMKSLKNNAEQAFKAIKARAAKPGL